MEIKKKKYLKAILTQIGEVNKITLATGSQNGDAGMGMMVGM